jgi:hypothetical protein
MSYVASKWKSLSDSECIMWQNEAKKLQRMKPSMLTEEDKKKANRKRKKKSNERGILYKSTFLLQHIHIYSLNFWFTKHKQCSIPYR